MLLKSDRLAALESGVLLFIKGQVPYEQRQHVLAVPENFQGREAAYLQPSSVSLLALSLPSGESVLPAGLLCASSA